MYFIVVKNGWMVSIYNVFPRGTLEYEKMGKSV